MGFVPAFVIGVLFAGQLDPLVPLGSLQEDLRSPARLAISADGTVLVTDPFNNRIVRFTAAGVRLVPDWDVPSGPIGVAAHPDGRYFVSLRDEPKVAIYDNTFAPLGFLGEGNPLVTFVRPTDIDIATDTGRIYVVDSGGDRIYGFDSNGDVATIFGIRGEGAGAFQYPSSIAVDEVAQRLLVADHDNYRIQVFTLDGLPRFSFGYRMKYVPGGLQEGWLVRTQGVEADGAGHVYVSDAMMSTVRIFDQATGDELGKVVEYGSLPGDVRTPCDVALSPDGSRLYVVSTNTSSVEMYQTPVFASRSSDPPAALKMPVGWPMSFGHGGVDDRDAAGAPGTRRPLSSCPPPPEEVGHPSAGSENAGTRRPFSSPMAMASIVYPGARIPSRTHPGDGPAGTNQPSFDSWLSLELANSDWLSVTGVLKKARGTTRARSAQSVEGTGGSRAVALSGYEGPHVIADDTPSFCWRCHALTGQPGDDVGLVEGQQALCLSCHTSGGQALPKTLHELDPADPYGTNPSAIDGRGLSHAWGVPAVNALADSVGPAPGGVMERYLDGGLMKCSTCHNQHNNNAGSPYLRVSNDGDAMCKECHAARDRGIGEGGSHPVGFDYPGGVGEFPADAAVSPLSLKEGNVECMTCHALHDADSGGANAGDGDGMLLRSANDETLCRTCHTDHVIHTPGGDWQPTCLDCHYVHDPANPNLSLVARTVRKQTVPVADKTVVFTAREGANSFDDGDPAAYDGICQVCHQDTSYHRHDGTGTPHNDGTTCTTCHPHDTGFMPTGGDCTSCHAGPQDNGDGIPVGGRRAIVSDGVNPNDFGNTSHHVRGEISGGDCLVCHDLSLHQQGQVRLKDPDDGAVIYDYDTATPEDMENFCINCHDEDGAADGPGTTPFIDGVTVPSIKGVAGSMWADSAHKAAGRTCTDCHGTNAHGSDNIKLLQAPQVRTLCYQCHTDGMINNALSGGVNDIQEAFSQGERHDLGTTFSVGGNTYTIECTSCHNPHVVTGKHWDVASGVSPVTRPDLSADPATNPRAMGTTLWGAAAGEKMRDFAAQAAGTGGWYFSTARGGTIAWDQGGYYQPPKAGAGYNFEFSGDVLPDYTTLCLDCHTHRMSAANPPVNWGQGIACTNNSVDPPDQRIECGAQHGLAPAGTPGHMSDSGTPGNWGASGNPDVLFHMNYVTRGRGAGHFMRWPYDSADRSAGINFVMSCTDCHEAHGSSAASMLRTTVNAYGPGTSNWNTMCNNCHYYYGGQHAGMSCGNASCHEANSIHRIIHVTSSGAGTQLRITAAADVNEYQRPEFTPEIVSVEGTVGSAELTVTFRESQIGAGPSGIYTNADLTGALTKDDFRLFDGTSKTEKLIDSVTHTPGSSVATVTMSSLLTAADLYSDLLSTAGKTVWGWYEGGYNNWATGVIPEQEVSAGPWPVTITLGPDPGFVITAAEAVVNSEKLWVEFSEPAYASHDGTGDLQVSDFTYTNNKGAASFITAVAHSAGDSTAIITIDQNLISGINGDIDNDTIAAASNAIYTASGYHMPGTPVTISLADDPRLLVVQGVEDHHKLAVWFSERIYTNADATGALVAGDLAFTDAGAGKGILSVDHTPGSVTATLTLTGIIVAADVGGASLTVNADSVYDITGNPVPTTPLNVVPVTPGVVSTISSVEGVAGSDRLAVTFQSQVYANDDETGSLGVGDFIYVDNVAGGASGIVAVSHAAGSPTAMITLDVVLDGTDIGGDTLAAAVGSIYGPSAGNFPVDAAPVPITAQLAPAITIVEGAEAYGQLFVSFSQGVYAESDGTGALQTVDFAYTDAGGTGAAAVSSVAHTPGSSTAIITLDTNLLLDDINVDGLAASAAEIFNSIGNPVGTGTVLISTQGGPAWGTSFPIENEPQYAPTVWDETGLLSGTVGNPTFALPGIDNDWLTCSELEGTFIDVDNTASLMSPRAITIEARVRPTEVDRGVGDNTFNRIFQRANNIAITILNTDYRGDDVPARYGKASVEVKYRVGATHTCPQPQWPADPYTGNAVWNHQISSDIDQFPIVNNHWYVIKVVFTSDKVEVAGSNGTPVDIFLDDQGTDGLDAPNPTPLDPTLNPDFEQWSGYPNVSKTINGSSSCKWGALPGDVILVHYDKQSVIGAAPNHGQPFEGLIDWVSWLPVADYAGVDDPPK